MAEINEVQTSKAVTALQKYFVENTGSQQKGKQELFSDNTLKAHFTFKKLPSVINGTKSVECSLIHSYLDKKNVSICLFVKDIHKLGRRNTDVSINYFKDLLRDQKNVDCIDEIITLKQLKIEYRTFEARRKLCSAYDLFLVDDRIVHVIGPYLGRCFVHCNKYRLPFPVKLTRGNLNNQIDKCLSISRAFLSPYSSRCCFKFGVVEQSLEELLENFMNVINSIKENFPGKLPNVRTISINMANWPMLPVYASTGSANDVKFEPSKSKGNKKPISCRMDSFDDPRVITVFPSGNIQVVNSKNNKDKLRVVKRAVKRVWSRTIKRKRREDPKSKANNSTKIQDNSITQNLKRRTAKKPKLEIKRETN